MQSLTNSIAIFTQVQRQIDYGCQNNDYQIPDVILVWHSNKLAVLDYPIQYGYIIEAAISYYPIRNGWKLWYGKNGLFYYKSIQDCRSYDLQNIGLKIHNFSLELKQSKTPPAASCWIISTLVRRYVFFNPRFCKSWDCPNGV